MPESTEGTESTGTEQTPQTNQQNGSTESTEQSPKTPEWYEKELSKTRQEAAGYRTKLRDAEAKLSTAKTVEEFETARKELADANKALERELMVERAGRGLPDELRAVLKGDTEAELKAHAEVLKKFAPVQEAPPERLSGGLNAGAGSDDGFDVKDVARKVRLGRL
ncbi:hypothetical protein [Micromonospora sp. WMMD736]|uniref:hypothetical protein n=1 Tax=Micromonospora sp. WMMD736 TaxID=3404112 RepID=UPI003B9460E8